MARPFVKTLSQKFWASPARVYPLFLPARLGHGCDATVLLHLVSTAISLPSRPQGRQQAGRHYLSRSRQRRKDEEIWMRCAGFCNLPIELHNRLAQTVD